jgi:O-antigen/teichoic acid export membrane protein
VVVGLTLGTEESGPFFAALRIAMVLNLFQIASNMIAEPKMSAAWASGEYESAKKVSTSVTTVFGLSSLALFILIASTSEQLLSLFAQEFSAYKTTLIITASAYLINVLGGLTGALMTATGNEKIDMLFITATHGLSIASMVPMAWALGDVGVAISLLAGYLLYNSAVNLFIYKRYGFWLFFSAKVLSND